MMACHDLNLNLDAARTIIAVPQMHTTAVLRRSIEVLKAYGDWMDFERAKQLERQLGAEALRPAPTVRQVVLTALDAAALFGLIFVGFWVAAGMGWE